MLPLSIFSVNLLSDNLLLLASVLVFFAILITKIGARFGAPSLLLFLLLGMIAGADGVGLKFEDYHIAESIGHFAMTIILFTGGLETSMVETKPVMKQGALLSTLGVFMTSILTALFIYFVAGKWIGPLGASFLGCFLLSAVMSSTDSASVFSVLRGKRMHLRENLSPMLELESGSNDPMAYVLTIILVQVLTSSKHTGSMAMLGTGAWVLLVQIVVGFLIGLGVGFGAKWILERVKLPSNALYSVMILSIGFFANGIASLLFGNGLLALYIAAIVIGNRADIPMKRDVLKFFDGMTWLMQLLMFLMLGLLARPSQFSSIAWPALMIGLFMMFVARPLSVFLCLAPFKGLSFKAKAFASWVGLKGAGPILFALCPVVAGLDGATEIFNIVFFISLLSLILQGMTLSSSSRWLGLSYEADPEVETFGMEIPEEMGMLRDHTVTEDDLQNGETLRDLHLPHGIRVMMVKRDGKFLVPHGSMQLQEGDHLVIIMGDTDD
ncbi:MAG: potassium/proton antiporter [Bacteroidales bacterium]|nr:potassium/proton antiporter [Bacteroidales bacterium]MBR4478554.1 potassium/proton antiporter [Bacteroidales bacterium]